MSVKIGDTVFFGDIKWRVLAMAKDNALLITENVIVTDDLHISIGGSWNNCELRKYLNGEFLERFSSKDVSAISNIELQTRYEYSSYEASENEMYDYNTTDKVFIFDNREADTYFSCNSERLATLENSEKSLIHIAPGTISGLSTAIVRSWMVDRSRLTTCGLATPYRLRNTYTYSDPQKGAWTYTGYVDTKGEINLHYLPKFCSIRPALWLDLEYLYTLDKPSDDTPVTDIPNTLEWGEIPESVTDEYIRKISGFEYGYNRELKGYSINGYAFIGPVETMKIPKSIWDIPVVRVAKLRGNFLHTILSVDIPDSVVEIGDNAFSGCYSLTDITIPNSVTKIGASAFQNCLELQCITIPRGVREIGSKAFHNCPKLTSATILNTLTNIAPDAFAESTELVRTK
jgi:hypothetical protein